MSEVASVAPGEAAAGERTSLQHRIEYGAYRLARAVLGVLPEGVALGIAGALGWFAGVVVRVRRRDVDAHLLQAFPDRDPAWRRQVARRSYVHLAREGALLFRMPRWSPGEIVERVERFHARRHALGIYQESGS